MLTCQVIGLHGQISVPEFDRNACPRFACSWISTGLTVRPALLSSGNERIAECWCSWNNVCVTDCTRIRSIDSNNGCRICIWNCSNLLLYCLTNPICCCPGWSISFRMIFKSRSLIGIQSSIWLAQSINLKTLLSLIHDSWKENDSSTICHIKWPHRNTFQTLCRIFNFSSENFSRAKFFDSKNGICFSKFNFFVEIVTFFE